MAQARVAAFQQALAELGWTRERNLKIEWRWTGGDVARVREYAAELVRLAPEVILAQSTPNVAAARTFLYAFVEARKGKLSEGLARRLRRRERRDPPRKAWLRVPVRRFLGEASGNLLWSLNWLLGSRFRGSRCWLRYHNRIGNGFRNIDGF